MRTPRSGLPAGALPPPGPRPAGHRWPLAAAVALGLLLVASTARAADPASPADPAATPSATQAVAGPGDARVTPTPAMAPAVPAVPPPAEPVTVPALDLNRYAGLWYEVARFPQFFQRNCAADVTARYSRRPDGLLRVDNRCRKKNGKRLRALGKARLPDADRPGELEVAFFLNFYADYWVLALGDAPDYGYAVVSNPKRSQLWILSRQPVMDARLYQRLLERLRADGFDLARLKPTLQTGHT